MIYLDNAGTTKPKREVIEAMLPYMETYWHNPSSLYKPAKDVRKVIDKCRENIADFINAKPDEIIFTSGGSESNCLAVQGFINQVKSRGFNPIIITSKIEHKSILDCVDNVAEEYHYIGVDSYGFVNRNDLELILDVESRNKNNRILVSLQFANNEIGVIQNIKELASLAHQYGAFFHTDAVQMFGNSRIDVKDLNVDMMSVSGHKIGMVKGIGFLYKNEWTEIKPIIYGSQEHGYRGGTENAPYIVGFSKAVSLLRENLDDDAYSIKQWTVRNYFINRLKKEFGCQLNGLAVNRLNNNINVTFKNNDITGEALIYMMDTCGVCIASGSACNSRSIEPSYVLKAIGLSDRDAFRTIRITID